jgi:hypothetical protein
MRCFSSNTVESRKVSFDGDEAATVRPLGTPV